jgi:ubiquinone/menaquinone biosynthesis C-methylase UbiE
MNNIRTCPVELSGGLDNRFRRFLQDPRKILQPFITPEMTVLDFGCGPGFFSIEIAKMLVDPGKLIAADLQQGMLDKVIKKIAGTELEHRIKIHKCESSKIGVTDKVDFVLLFYVIHEVANQDSLLKELKTILKPGGRIFIIEPKIHVTKKDFEKMTGNILKLGFEIIDSPKVFFSRTLLLTHKD